MEKGEKVKGDAPPHGGSWTYNAETGEYELVEEPTSMEPKPEPEPAKTEEKENKE